MRKFTFDIFVRYARRHYEENSDFLRYGQALANYLWATRPNLYRSMPKEVDPYLSDSRVEEFLQWVSDRWEDTTV